MATMILIGFLVVIAALALLAGAVAPPAGARARKKDKELEVAFTSAGCPKSIATNWPVVAVVRHFFVGS